MYAPALQHPRALVLKILNKSKLEHICMILKAPGHQGAAFIFKWKAGFGNRPQECSHGGIGVTPLLSRSLLMEREPGSPDGPKAPCLG